MKTAPLAADESLRLEPLRHYDILDTPPEEFYDRLTQLSAEACQVPIAVVSLVMPAHRDVVAVVHATVRLIENLGMTMAHRAFEIVTSAAQFPKRRHKLPTPSNAALASSRVS